MRELKLDAGKVREYANQCARDGTIVKGCAIARHYGCSPSLVEYVYTMNAGLRDEIELQNDRLMREKTCRRYTAKEVVSESTTLRWLARCLLKRYQYSG